MQQHAYLFAERSEDVPPARAAQLEEHAAAYWERFYIDHGNGFYKDRHYLDREWPELATAGQQGPATVLEVGCGAGNTVYPLLQANPQITRVYACDFAASAVQLVKAHPDYASGRVCAFVADLTRDDLCAHVPAASVDVVTMVFVLSAVSPEHMLAALRNVARTMRPGGRLLFRDFAEGDLSEGKRQKASQARRLGKNFYARGDGTRCFHFDHEGLRSLFDAAGFQCCSMHTHVRDVENRKRGITMHRRWVQAAFALAPAAGTRHVAEPGVGGPQGSGQGHQQGGACSARPPELAGAGGPGAGPQQQQQQQQQQQGRGGAGASSGHSGGCDGAGGGAGDGATHGARREAGGASSGGGFSGSSMRWLTGAAARLASCSSVLPGVPSGRALLPESLDPADDVAVTLSPSAPTHAPPPAGAHAAAGGGSPQHPPPPHAPRRAPRDVEADVEAEFFACISRATQDVVDEELAAAGLAGIRLAGQADADAWPPAAAQRAAEGQGGSGGGAVAAAAGGCGPGGRDTVAVAPGLSLHRHWPAPEGGQGGHWHGGVLLPPGGCGAGAQGGGGGLGAAAAAELLLAQLVGARPPQLACITGQAVLQLAAGPGCLAAAAAVRCAGARRVLATHPSRACLAALAASLHANAPLLVIERLRLAQLVMGAEGTVANAAGQAHAGGGAQQGGGGYGAVLCADLWGAAAAEAACMAEAGGASGGAGWQQLMLQGLHAVLRGARRLIGAAGQGGVFVALAAPDLVEALLRVAPEAGWRADAESSNGLGSCVQGLQQAAGTGTVAAVAVLLRAA